MIKGITVYIHEPTVVDEDPFGAPVVRESIIPVKNVLVGEPSTDDITTSTNLYGKRISYMLGIPKGDTNEWKDRTVSWSDAYGQTHTVKTFGEPITGIEANIPTKWHKKVRCEEYG